MFQTPVSKCDNHAQHPLPIELGEKSNRTCGKLNSLIGHI
jgi:hypothetical protein